MGWVWGCSPISTTCLPTADAATPSVTQAAEATRFLVGVVRGSLSSLIGPAEPLFFSSATCFFSVHLISQSPPCRVLASLLPLL